jgi:polar amino acid transport system substrate-binding protein
MMKTWTATKLFLAAICVTVLTVPAYADQLSRVKAAGELVVGTGMQFPPFAYLKDGKQVGFNEGFFDRVGKELGVKVRFIDLPWSSTLPGLDAKKFDMVGGPLNVTKARMEHYAFTLPIAEGTVGILVRTNDKSINTSADIAGKAVGSQRGSSQVVQLKKFSDTLTPKPEVKEYIDFDQAYADLAAGRIVGVANSMTNLAYAANERPKVFRIIQPPFGDKIYFAYMGHQDEDSRSLLEAINQVIRSMHKDGSLAALQKKWFGTEMAVPTSAFVPDA